MRETLTCGLRYHNVLSALASALELAMARALSAFRVGFWEATPLISWESLRCTESQASKGKGTVDDLVLENEVTAQSHQLLRAKAGVRVC